VAECGADIVTVRSVHGQDECLVCGAGYLLLCREQRTRRARSGMVGCFKSNILSTLDFSFGSDRKSWDTDRGRFFRVAVGWAGWWIFCKENSKCDLRQTRQVPWFKYRY